MRYVEHTLRIRVATTSATTELQDEPHAFAAAVAKALRKGLPSRLVATTTVTVEAVVAGAGEK